METSNFITFCIEHNVPQETVFLILMLPVIVTLVAFFRQVFGIKAFGIYTPSIITFAFLAMGGESELDGIKYGVTIFTSVIFVGMIMRYMLKKVRLLYLPRVAITLTIVAFAILAVLLVGGSTQRTGLAAVSIFPLLIMITIVEKFVTAQIEKGNKTAIILATETLVISLAGYFLVSWQSFQSLILTYPSLILLTILINVFLGKWTGLRITEYWRFKEVFKKF